MTIQTPNFIFLIVHEKRVLGKNREIYVKADQVRAFGDNFIEYMDGTVLGDLKETGGEIAKIMREIHNAYNHSN
jgi:hypothetical protein